MVYIQFLQAAVFAVARWPLSVQPTCTPMVGWRGASGSPRQARSGSTVRRGDERGNNDQNELLPGHEFMITRGVRRRMRRPPMIFYPIRLDWFPARPVAQQSQMSPAHGLARRGSRRASTISGGASG